MGTTPTIESLRPKEDANQIQFSSSKNIEEDGKRSTAKSDISKNWLYYIFTVSVFNLFISLIFCIT